MNEFEEYNYPCMFFFLYKINVLINKRGYRPLFDQRSCYLFTTSNSPILQHVIPSMKRYHQQK